MRVGTAGEEGEQKAQTPSCQNTRDLLCHLCEGGVLHIYFTSQLLCSCVKRGQHAGAWGFECRVACRRVQSVDQKRYISRGPFEHPRGETRLGGVAVAVVVLTVCEGCSTSRLPRRARAIN